MDVYVAADRAGLRESWLSWQTITNWLRIFSVSCYHYAYSCCEH